MKSQFMNSIVNVKVSYCLESADKVKFLSEMKQLTLLTIGSNQLGDESAKYISENNIKVY